MVAQPSKQGRSGPDGIVTSPTLVGLKIDLARWSKPEPPCRRCGIFRVVVTHGTELACENCGLPRGKLPEHVTAFLRDSIRAFFSKPADINAGGTNVVVGSSTFEPRTSIDAPPLTEATRWGMRGAKTFHDPEWTTADNDNKDDTD